MIGQDLVRSFLPEDREGKLGMGVGGTLLALGVLDGNSGRGRVLKVAGAAVVAYFFLRERAATFATREEITADAALPAGNDGVSTQEKWNAVVGRVFGMEPEAGIEHATDRPAIAGPHLGAPKNVLRVAGAWRQPTDGGSFALAAFSETFQAFAVLENQSAQEVAGEVRVRITHEGLLQSGAQQTYFDGPSVRLAPGEMRELSMRLPAVRDFDGRIELALLFANYNLATITAQRELVLA